jgi:hypothetical protein
MVYKRGKYFIHLNGRNVGRKVKPDTAAGRASVSTVPVTDSDGHSTRKHSCKSSEPDTV